MRIRGHRGALLGLLACAVIAASIAAYVSRANHAQARIFFESALTEAGVDEPIVIHGAAYRVHDGAAYTEEGAGAPDSLQGQVFALAYAKSLARRAPLFHLAGTDPAELNILADSLEASQKKLAEYQTGKQAQLVGSLFPIEFLRSIASLEEARLRFLSTGGDTDAHTYAATLESTVGIYKGSLRDFIRTFDSLVSKDRRPYVSGDAIVDRDGVLRMARSLLTGADGASTVVHKRAACISGRVHDCDTADLTLPRVVPASGNSDQSAALAHTLVAQRVRQELGLPIVDTLNGERIVGLDYSACIPPGWDVPPYFAFSAETADFHGLAYRRSGLASDIFFLKEAEHTDVPFFRALEERGMRYIPAQPLAHYKCIKIDQDLGALAAVRDTYEFASTTPLSHYAAGPEKEGLLALEHRLSAPVVTERDARSYLAAAAELLGRDTLPEGVRNALIELILEMRDRSAGTFVAALDTAFLTETTINLQHEGIPTDLTADYLAYIRSGFPALYMASNPSAQNAVPYAFQSNTIPRDAQPYILLTDLVPELATDPELRAQISKDFTTWKNLHQYEQ